MLTFDRITFLKIYRITAVVLLSCSMAKVTKIDALQILLDMRMDLSERYPETRVDTSTEGGSHYGGKDGYIRKISNAEINRGALSCAMFPSHVRCKYYCFLFEVAEHRHTWLNKWLDNRCWYLPFHWMLINFLKWSSRRRCHTKFVVERMSV